MKKKIVKTGEEKDMKKVTDLGECAG